MIEAQICPVIKDINTPIIAKSGLDFAAELVLWIDKRITRVRWPTKQVDREFARRSANKILLDGDTFYMNPCLDLTLATAAVTQRNGIPHTLLIEEHGPTEDFKFNRLHFALEVQEEPNLTYFINYRNGNNVEIGEGKYLGREDLPQLQIVRKEWYEMNYAKPLHENLGYRTLSEALRKLFRGYDFSKQVSRLKKDNKLKNYEKYQQLCGNEFNIKVVRTES